MLAMMVIAQITVLSGAPRPSSEDAARTLRAIRSPANLTDVVLADGPDVPTPAARSTWKPGDGPFGSFGDQLSRLQIPHSGRTPWSRVSPASLHFARFRPNTVRPSLGMSVVGRTAFRPQIPRLQRVRLMTWEPRHTSPRSYRSQ